MASDPGAAVYTGLINRGYAPLQAAVLTGNIQQESGFSPDAYNGQEDAAGLLQWRQDRLDGLESYAKATGRSPSDPDTQLDWLVKEMQGPEAKTAAPFFTAADPQSANAALKGFIRYGDDSQGARLQNAMAFLAPNKVSPAASDGAPGGSSDGAAATAAKTAGAASPGPAGASAPLSKDDFLKQWGAGPSDTVTPSSAPDAGSAASKAAFLKMWGVSPADATSPSAAPAAPSQPATASPRQYPTDASGAIDTGNPMTRGSPKPSGGNMLTGVADQLSAGFSSGVNAIPVAGPFVLGALEAAKAAAQNTAYGNKASPLYQPNYLTQSPQDVSASDHAQVAANPVAAGIGAAAGTILPLALAPESAFLGTSADASLPIVGNLGARVLGAGVSSGAIEGADTLARGGSLDQAGENALIATGIGGAIPVVGKGVRSTVRKFFGQSADQMVGSALERDQMPVNQLTGSPMAAGATLADVGPNTQALAATLAKQGGKPEQVLANTFAPRSAAAPNRLMQAVEDTVGAPARSVDEEAAALTRAQKAAADPLYAAVKDTQVQMTPGLEAMRQSPMGQAAFEQGAKMAANDGYLPRGTTVGLLDYTKQALDDVARSAAREGKDNVARQAGQMSAALRTEVDAQAPGYAAARNAYAGPEAVKDALKLGQSVFDKNLDPTDLQSQIAQMSDSEKDALLVGAQNAVRQLVGNSRNDVTALKSITGPNSAMAKLGMLIGRANAAHLADVIDREATFANTAAGVDRGARAAAATAAERSVAQPSAPVASAAQPSALGVLKSMFDGARRALTGVYHARQNVAAANMLAQGALSPEAAGRISSAVGSRFLKIAPAVGNQLLQGALPGPANPFTGPRAPLNVTIYGGAGDQ